MDLTFVEKISHNKNAAYLREMRRTYSSWPSRDSSYLEQAIEIADQYNWNPEFSNDFVMKSLRAGVVPEGFGKVVGATIAMFLHPMTPFSKTELQEAQDRIIAKHLARLRVCIAKINIRNQNESSA